MAVAPGAVAQSALRSSWAPADRPGETEVMRAETKKSRDESPEGRSPAGDDASADAADGSGPATSAADPNLVRCIRTDRIRAAEIEDDQSIRLTLRGGKQVLMRLENRCFGLAFDRSFYYRTSPTGELCAGFDTIMARAGSRCLISRFELLPAQTESRAEQSRAE